MKIIIAGGRDFNDYVRVEREVSIIIPVDIMQTLLCGMASGADELGLRLAKRWGWGVRKFPADWDKHGKAAGPIRNEEMAKEGDVLFAFWDGKSRGTKHMISTALRYGLEVHVYRY